MRKHQTNYMRTPSRLSKHILLVCTLCLLPISAFAQEASVPPLINYQGMLTDANGEPLATADYELSFSIFSDTTGGAAV